VHPSDVRIKICGLTRVDEALACLEAGADWIGLNFHPGSPRFVDPDCAAEIIAALPCPSQAVGLFVDRPADEVAATAARLGLAAVQLHGDEPPDDLLVLSHLRIIRAFRLGNAGDVRGMGEYLARAEALGRGPDAVLVDAYVPGRAGGTGTAIVGELLPLIPPHPRLILAGGLTPENVAERCRTVRPWMVDVASGVESSPGRKDPEKVRRFIQALKSACAPGDARTSPAGST
jgi:phosphoribosylanthranilate isomerase